MPRRTGNEIDPGYSRPAPIRPSRFPKATNGPRKRIIKEAIKRSPSGPPGRFSKGPRFGGPQGGRPKTGIKRATGGINYLRRMAGGGRRY